MTIPEAALRETFEVRTYDCDETSALSLGSLLGFLQEAAGLHAERLGVSMARLNEHDLAWMLHRLKLELPAEAKLTRRVEVCTWPTGFVRAFATRDFHVTCGDEVVARGSSAWLIASMVHRRAIRIPDWVQEIDVPECTPHFSLESRRVSTVKAPDRRMEHRVRRADLDALLHVNNVRYAEWAAEAVRAPVWQQQRLTAIDLLFRAEALYGDVVVADGQARPEGRWDHRLWRLSDGAEVAQAATCWAPRD